MISSLYFWEAETTALTTTGVKTVIRDKKKKSNRKKWLKICRWWGYCPFTIHYTHHLLWELLWLMWLVNAILDKHKVVQMNSESMLFYPLDVFNTETCKVIKIWVMAASKTPLLPVELLYVYMKQHVYTVTMTHIETQVNTGLIFTLSTNPLVLV